MSVYKVFLKPFFGILDAEDKKKFYLITILILISGILSLLSIGAVLPFLTLLLSPDKNIFGYYLLPKWTTQHLFGWSVVVLIISYWIKNITAWICLYGQSKILYDISFKLSRRLFENYLRAPYFWHLQRNTPDLIRNINNECVVFSAILISFGSFLTESFAFVCLISALLYIDYKFTLMIILGLGCSLSVFLYITRISAEKHGQNRSCAYSKMIKSVMQGLGGIKETCIYHKEEYFLSNFNEQSNLAQKSAVFSIVYSQSSRFIIEIAAVTMILSMVVLFSISGYSQQKIFLLLSIMGVSSLQLLPSINRIMAAITQIRYGLSAVTTLHNELKEEGFRTLFNVPTNRKIVFNDKITLMNLRFCYSDEAVVLDSIFLEIKKGQTIAFMGHSGAGKTTLVDIILGLLTPSLGAIYVDGVKINHENHLLWQNCLGYVPQLIFIYDCSIRENIAFAESLDQIDDNKIWRALEIVNLQHVVNSLPQGLDTKIGENGIRLSGGQRQRLGIARAIYREPDVLIMDEATSSLDNETEKEVTEAIKKVSINRTVITIAHRLSTVKHSDVIFLLKNGKVIAKGKYNDLLKSSSDFRSMVCEELPVEAEYVN